MSLVAYASSDEESNASESEKDNSSARDFVLDNGEGRRQQKRPGIENETEQEEEVGCENASKRSIFSFLPPPKKDNDSYVFEEDDTSVLPKSHIETRPSVISKPVHHNAIVKPAKAVEENSEEDSVKRSTKLVLPKPKASSKDATKQKMKIAVSSLPDVDSDSDDEGTTGKKKRLITSNKKGSGLVSCLPQPLGRPGSVSVIKNNEKKPAKRLIPYTLSKKKEDNKINKTVNEDSDSESDGEATSFFSFSENTDTIKQAVGSLEMTSGKESIESSNANRNALKIPNNIPLQNSSSVKPVANTNLLDHRNEVQNQSSTETRSSSKNETIFKSANNHFKANKLKEHNITESSKNNSLLNIASHGKVPEYNNSGIVTGPYIEDSVTGHYPVGSTGELYAKNNAHSFDASHVTGPYYNTYVPEVRSTSEYYNDSASSTYLNPEPTGMYSQYGTSAAANHQTQVEESLDYDQLRRLQGKRDRRNHIDFVDISAEAMKVDQTTLLKSVSEEQTHVSKKLKSDNPSSQQRRKHQITYLAFQAKEREQALKKSWAASSQSRRQTQQKYGF